MKDELLKTFDGKYLINTLGELFSRKKNTGELLVRKKKLSPSVSKFGYYTYSFRRKDRRETKLVHRLVAIQFLPNPENKREVNHKNGIKTDNRVENLEWATSSENKKHAYRLGLWSPPYGAKCGTSKLTETQVTEILNNKTRLQVQMAKDYNVHVNTISNILRGKRWKHLKQAHA